MKTDSPTYAREQKRPRGGIVAIWKRHIWDRVAVDKASGCWIMQTPRDAQGYAKTSAPKIGRIWAHRLAFLAYNGNLPSGRLVLHSPKCTSRACVNPEHLRIGDAKENARDRDLTGTTARGDRHGRRKLSGAQVEQIRRVSDRTPVEAIALAFGVSEEHVRAIKSGRYWKESE